LFFIELQKFNKTKETLTNHSRTKFFLNFNFLIFRKWQFLAEILCFIILLQFLKKTFAQYFAIEKRLVYMKIKKKDCQYKQVLFNQKKKIPKKIN
jgi:hypothetical protein